MLIFCLSLALSMMSMFSIAAAIGSLVDRPTPPAIIYNTLSIIVPLLSSYRHVFMQSTHVRVLYFIKVFLPLLICLQMNSALSNSLLTTLIVFIIIIIFLRYGYCLLTLHSAGCLQGHYF